MLEKREHRDRDELRDPGLSALLREALADDPALSASPGRTDRIMRKVLASGVRPTQRSIWAPLAWATGSLASAAAAVFVILALTGQPILTPDPGMPTPRQIAANTQTSVDEPTVAPASSTQIPEVRNVPQAQWIETSKPVVVERSSVKASEDNGMKRVTEGGTQADPAKNDNTDSAAATLYAAGTAAHAVGDYETAYQAYQASYEAEPTPEALLASSHALEQLAREELDGDGSQS